MRHQLQSSMMKSVEYTDGVLNVEFNNGVSYDYKGVSRKEFDELLAAKSAGRHFYKEIQSKCKGEKCK